MVTAVVMAMVITRFATWKSKQIIFQWSIINSSGLSWDPSRPGWMIYQRRSWEPHGALLCLNHTRCVFISRSDQIRAALAQDSEIGFVHFFCLLHRIRDSRKSVNGYVLSVGVSNKRAGVTHKEYTLKRVSLIRRKVSLWVGCLKTPELVRFRHMVSLQWLAYWLIDNCWSGIIWSIGVNTWHGLRLNSGTIPKARYSAVEVRNGGRVMTKDCRADGTTHMLRYHRCYDITCCDLWHDVMHIVSWDL